MSDVDYAPNMAYEPEENRMAGYMPYEQYAPVSPDIPPPHYTSTSSSASYAAVNTPKWDTKKLFSMFGLSMAGVVLLIAVIVLLARLNKNKK